MAGSHLKVSTIKPEFSYQVAKKTPEERKAAIQKSAKIVSGDLKVLFKHYSLPFVPFLVFMKDKTDKRLSSLVQNISTIAEHEGLPKQGMSESNGAFIVRVLRKSVHIPHPTKKEIKQGLSKVYSTVSIRFLAMIAHKSDPIKKGYSAVQSYLKPKLR